MGPSSGTLTKDDSESLRFIVLTLGSSASSVGWDFGAMAWGRVWTSRRVAKSDEWRKLEVSLLSPLLVVHVLYQFPSRIQPSQEKIVRDLLAEEADGH